MLLILEHNNFFHKYNINQKNKVSSDKINKRDKVVHYNLKVVMLLFALSSAHDVNIYISSLS